MVIKKRSKLNTTAKKYSPTDQLEREAIHALEGILGFEYVKPHLYGNDRTPNNDGYIEVLEADKSIAGQVFVQVKKIRSGSTKYSLEAQYIDFGINVCSSPFFVFCLDVKNEILYWRRIDNRIVLKKGKGSVTIHFKQEDTVKKGNRKKHIIKWIEILKKHKEALRISSTKVEIYKSPVSVQSLAKNEIINVRVPLTETVKTDKYKKEIDRAKILFDSEKFIAAKKIYGKILPKIKRDQSALDSTKFKVLTNLANCHYILGNIQEAIVHYKLAFDVIEIKSEIAFKNRALASLLEEKPQEGITYIDEAIKLNKTIENINLKSTLLREAGLPDDALKLYEEGDFNEK